MKSEYEMPPVKQNRLGMEGHSLSLKLPMFVYAERNSSLCGFYVSIPIKFYFFNNKVTAVPNHSLTGTEVVCLCFPLAVRKCLL